MLEELSWNAVRFFEDDEDKGNFKRTCREIVAEVQARLFAGQPVKPEVMEIYKRILNNQP